jgi:hypothetical protein
MLELSGAHSRPSPMPMIGSLGRRRIQSRRWLELRWRSLRIAHPQRFRRWRAGTKATPWQDAHCRAARADDRRRRQDTRMEERFASRLLAPHAAADALITRAYLDGTNTRRVRRALNGSSPDQSARMSSAASGARSAATGTNLETAAMFFRAPLASVQIAMRKVDGASRRSQTIRSLTSHFRIASCHVRWSRRDPKARTARHC